MFLEKLHSRKFKGSQSFSENLELCFLKKTYAAASLSCPLTTAALEISVFDTCVGLASYWEKISI